MSQKSGHAFLRSLTQDAPAKSAEEPALDDFDAVFRHHAAYVSGVLFKVLGPSADIEDLVQDVFLDAYGSLHTIEEPRALRRWLSVLAVRKAYRLLRRKRIKTFFGLLGEDIPDVEAPTLSPERAALLSQLYRELDKLPADDRMAWALRHIEGMTIKEVAEVSETSISTAKRRVKRAQEHLDKIF